MAGKETHPEFKKYDELWTRCRDCFKGEDAIKAKGPTYLPYLTEQATEEYNSYKDRAVFLNTFHRTITGLVGGAMRKRPLINVPSGMEPLLEDIDLMGTNIEDFIKQTLIELFITGRVISVCDRFEDGRPYLTRYLAENFVNWSYAGMIEKYAVFCEEVELDPSSFTHETVEQYRAYVMEEEGVFVYTMREAIDEETNEPTLITTNVVPLTLRGETLKRLPITVINTTECGFKVEEPPLLDLANVCLSHYRSSADLEHGRHFTALPQAYITGVDPDEYMNGVHVGGSRAWLIPNEQAKVGFLEFSGQGLGSLEKAIDQKERMMAILGARLLEGPKGVEAAETARIRQNTETSILGSLVRSLGRGIERSLKIMAEWEGYNPDDVSIEMNTDFIDVKIPYQEVIALVQSYQMGGISLDTLLHNLKKGEIIPHDVTIEEERDKIVEDTFTSQWEKDDNRGEVLEGGQEPFREVANA